MENTRINLIFLINVIALIFTMSSCKDSPCDTPAVGESFILSDTVKAFVSNYEDAEIIVFSNESGSEIEFNVSEIEDSDSPYNYSAICQDDASMRQLIKGTSQFVQLSITNLSEIPEPIFISLSEIPVPSNINETKEDLVVTSGERFSNSYEEDDHLLWIRFDDMNSDLIFHDSLEIHGKTFYSVFEPDNSSLAPEYEIKYTRREGIIFIGNPDIGEEYVYERKE